MQVRHWVIFDVVWGQQHRLSLLKIFRLHMKYPSLKKIKMTAIQWEYYYCCVIADVIIGPVLDGQEIGKLTGYR